jgi:formylglycine-generating enzyme required for sulfatase activity
MLNLSDNNRLRIFIVVTLLSLLVVPTTVAQGPPQVGEIALDPFGFEMVYVPSGTFEMGVDENTVRSLVTSLGFEYNSGFARPEIFDTYTVRLEGYWIDRFEVTVAQYQAFCNAGVDQRCLSIEVLQLDERFINNPDKPIVGVTWLDATAFCARRIARLPTEEEWEYAAGGPENFLFPWGNEPRRENITASFSEGTYLVGTRPGNVSWVGAFDMAGNAEEWVEDRYFPAYSATVEVEGEGSNFYDYARVARGGNYINPLPFVTTYTRSDYPPDIPIPEVGFRCARSSDPRNN